MATGSLFSMDVLDQLWWALASFVLLRLLLRQALYLWSIVGAILEPSALEMRDAHPLSWPLPRRAVEGKSGGCAVS
jgi:hypothetical protein